MNKLFVGNVSYKTTQSHLIDLFEKVGSVKSCRLAINARTNMRKGYALVEMSTEEDARNALAQLHLTEVDGKLIVVRPFTAAEEEATASVVQTVETAQPAGKGNGPDVEAGAIES